ncbi:hypothetical protein CCR75_001035 [Bremia lactucae]|uniref:Uncharacterized protein n=1 Tax=Bremia lactucae TaxID=4779 RepID=A0A976NYH6_BRELC|nr:hypothetical protein CCR75_001035 [Bremia lactucae]
MGKNRRGPRRAISQGDAIVVINASMLRRTTSSLMETPLNSTKKEQKKRKDQSIRTRRLSKKQKPNHDANTVSSDFIDSSSLEVSPMNPRNEYWTVLRVKRDADVLAGLYGILLSRTTSRSCVVVLPHRYETSPSQLANILKHLGLQAVSIHQKMASKQKKEAFQRFQASVDAAMSTHAMILVTTDHMCASVRANAMVVLVGAVNNTAMTHATTFLQVSYVTTSDFKAVHTFQLELSTPCLQQLQARFNIAQQIVAITQHVAKMEGRNEQTAKWVHKITNGADFDENEDHHKTTKQRKTREEQRLQALTEKLYVMLTRDVSGLPASSSRKQESESDRQHRHEKLRLLGLVTINASVGTALLDGRTSAQTRWMDYAEGKRYKGQWLGTVRHGATKDSTSLELRKQVSAAQQTIDPSSFLCQWQPNKEPIDSIQWGGAFGKVCGHNEVVMHELRAFYPQEVLNTKVCSKLFPAPGNQGFDGCLEHLRYACIHHRTSMTLWDAEFFLFLSSNGRVTWSKKHQLLSLSLASLQCLVPALRSWTAACEGRMPPNAVLRAIQLCCQLGSGAKKSSDGKLSLKILKRIMSFEFGGSTRLWQQIANVGTPLDEEMVYDSQ